MAGEVYDRFVYVPMMIAIIIYLVVITLTNRRLREFHPAQWEKLGSWSPFMNNSISNSWKMLQFFILTSDYKQIGDEALDKYALAARILFGISMTLFGISLVLTLSGKIY